VRQCPRHKLARHQESDDVIELDVEAVTSRTDGMQDLITHRRLPEPIGNIPPAEAEAAYHASLEELEISTPDANQTAFRVLGVVHLLMRKAVGRFFMAMRQIGLSDPQRAHPFATPECHPNQIRKVNRINDIRSLTAIPHSPTLSANGWRDQIDQLNQYLIDSR
jgi:hypothetical protein